MLSIVRMTPNVMLVSVTDHTSLDFGDLYRYVRTTGGWVRGLIAAKSARFLTVDAKGSAYYPYPGGLCALSPNEAIHWAEGKTNTPFVEISGASFPARVLHDRFDCLWIRNQISGSVRNPGDPVFHALREVEGKADDFGTLVETKDGSIIMLGDLEVGRQGAFHVARGRNGLPSDLRAMIMAHDGTIWLGAGDGLYRFMYPFRMEY